MRVLCETTSSLLQSNQGKNILRAIYIGRIETVWVRVDTEVRVFPEPHMIVET